MFETFYCAAQVMIFVKPILQNRHNFRIAATVETVRHQITYQNYEQPCQRSQNSEIQSNFSVSRLVEYFQKNISLKNI